MTMTKEEAEAKKAELLHQIYEAYKQYAPNAGSLCLAINRSDRGDSISFFNRYWSDDVGHPLNYFKLLGGGKDD